MVSSGEKKRMVFERFFYSHILSKRFLLQIVVFVDARPFPVLTFNSEMVVACQCQIALPRARFQHSLRQNNASRDVVLALLSDSRLVISPDILFADRRAEFLQRWWKQRTGHTAYRPCDKNSY